MIKNEILHGDCLEMLKTLPDDSVNCCITSPPYYGLRDYGTGTWVGGDPKCPHKRLNKLGKSTSTGHAQDELNGNVGDSIYKTVCKDCGAVRVDNQIGLEETPKQYIQKLVDVFSEVHRILKDDGVLWVNIGDSYCGSHGNDKRQTIASNKDVRDSYDNNHISLAGGLSNLEGYKPKDLIGIPWMLAFALRESGWYLRQDIIWAKPNPMPESVKDRCTKSHEYIFMLTKSAKYYFDYEAIQERATGYDGRLDTVNKGSPKSRNGNYMPNGQHINSMAANGHERWSFKDDVPIRNKRDVWTVVPSHYKEAHFATFPEELIRPMVLAGCPKDGIVLDPFMGSGTVGVVAKQNNRNYIGIELNGDYIKMANRRIANTVRKLF